MGRCYLQDVASNSPVKWKKKNNGVICLEFMSVFIVVVVQYRQFDEHSNTDK